MPQHDDLASLSSASTVRWGLTWERGSCPNAALPRLVPRVLDASASGRWSPENDRAPHTSWSGSRLWSV